jgi:hypothetical protein
MVVQGGSFPEYLPEEGLEAARAWQKLEKEELL